MHLLYFTFTETILPKPDFDPELVKLYSFLMTAAESIFLLNLIALWTWPQKNIRSNAKY